jgi:K+-sensing histidine kinase KdpD
MIPAGEGTSVKPQGPSEPPGPPAQPRGPAIATDTAHALLDGLWPGPLGLAVVGDDLRLVEVNGPFAELTAVAPAEHAGRRLAEVAAAHPPEVREDMDRLEDACRVVLETGGPFLNLVARGPAPGGGIREWLCSLFPVAGAAGSARGAVVMVTDATDDREREAALARARDDAQRALRRIERLLELTAALSQARTAEDVMSVLVLEADRAFGVDSAVAYALRGGALELVAAMGPAHDARHRPASLALDAPTPVSAAVRTRAPIWLETREEIVARFPGIEELSPRTAELSAMAAFPLRVGDEVLGAIGFGFAAPGPHPREDLELFAAAAEQCALALDRARLLDRERVAKAAEAANAARMERIVAMLLEYAHLQGGVPLRIEARPCDLATIAAAVADECEAAYPGSVVRRRGTGSGAGRWDPDRIAEVLANLVSNALRYGTPGVPVDVAWRDEGEQVVLEVANVGRPIPPEMLRGLFEPFHRAGPPDAAEREGLGIGLFVSRAIVAAHGGTMEARSGEGEPTVFTLRLPRALERG